MVRDGTKEYLGLVQTADEGLLKDLHERGFSRISKSFSVQSHAACVETIRSAPLRNQVRTLSQALASGQLDFSQLGLEHLVRPIHMAAEINSSTILLILKQVVTTEHT